MKIGIMNSLYSLNLKAIILVKITMNKIKIKIIKIFPKEIQKLIWKSLFDDILHNELKVKTKGLDVYEDSKFQGHQYIVKLMEKLLYYTYIHYDDKAWGLGLGWGKRVSNAEAIGNFRSTFSELEAEPEEKKGPFFSVASTINY